MDNEDGIAWMHMWDQWIWNDFRETGDMTTLYEYVNFRHWLHKEHPGYKVKFSKKRSMSIWFDCAKVLDKSALMYMDHKKKYRVVKKYRGYTVVETKGDI